MSDPVADGRADERDHLVSFYDGDAGLVDALTGFFLGGFEQGGAAIVVATESHRLALESSLVRSGLLLDKLRRRSVSGVERRQHWIDSCAVARRIPKRSAR